MADADTIRDRLAFLRSLRSTRHFRPDPVPQQVIDDLLEVARWSGSAKNRQHWELVVVRDRPMLEALASVQGAAWHLAGAAVGIVLVMAGDPDLVEQETFDEGKLSERIMLAALAHGVGSCIGWFRGDGMLEAKALLGIPEERLVRTVVSLGYPDQEAQRARRRPPQPRKPVEQIVRYDRYA